MTKSAKKRPSATTPLHKRRSQRPPIRSLPAWIVGAAILVLVLSIFAIWLKKGDRDAQISIPAYEEAGADGFTLLLDEVELAIYQSLRQLGVNTSQVQFRKVVHQTRRKRQWDYAELEVSLVQNQSLSQVEPLFAENLAALDGKITWKAHRGKDPNLELLIRVEEVLTHRLAFYVSRKQPTRESPPGSTAKMAIVIDDFGYDGRLARQFLEIDGPLSFSVLPHGTFSKSIARRVAAAGRELLLHLPMEPKGYPETNPGIGALLVEMTDQDLVQTLRNDLDSVPHIVGVNNHMGSRFCEHEQKMRIVMMELKGRGLFFLDSRTSRRTTAYRVAMQLNIPAAERDVFLDNIQSPQAIRGQMRRLIQIAQLKGRAIGIAHPYETTFEVLSKTIPQLHTKGIELVSVSQLLQK